MIARPMKPQWFQILLALARQPLHGYGIQRAVLSRTEDQMCLWPAMLYRSLATLEEEGLIQSVATPDHEPDDERRQYYALTPAGQTRLREESEMLARWARVAEAELS
jgi:DNA-binding PadR family transcriptional regulator